jgi:L-ascorbate metabolism protein UlaG (beta-lactamase superfamily)
MRITHIYHSGFAVELASHSLVFDWYTGELPELPRDKPLVVFVSHIHGDHYGRCIWDLRKEFDDVTYVLDEEVARLAPRQANVVSVKAFQSYEVAGLDVRTTESNDEGVAFLVSAPDARLFFSGDLNAWWWDRLQEENEVSAEFFRRKLSRLDGPVDVGFVPVDPRLVDPVRGLVIFEEALGAKLVVPMHYWDDRATVERLVAEDPRLEGVRDAVCFADVIDFDPASGSFTSHDGVARP